MVYQVSLTQRAESDLEAIFYSVQAGSSPAAARWFTRLSKAIDGLAFSPQRHPVTPENSSFRHLLFGNKPHSYRVVYVIDAPAKLVTILHVRHGAQRPFTGNSF